jgi:hypothetical protein
MNYIDTPFKDLKSVCIVKYGNEKGLHIYEKAEENFQKMLEEADYRNSDMIKWHMTNYIFPILAYYMSLLDAGFISDDAYANTLEVTQKQAMAWRDKYKVFGKIPFLYPLFKIGCKKVMNKEYPVEGWETDWIRYDKEEVSFNMKRCVYFEVTSQYGHAELCTIFCKNDTTTFSAFAPKVIFERSGTLGMGNECCDFHFKNRKYIGTR